jgi:DNA-binding NarL/FixJ family response regulator
MTPALGALLVVDDDEYNRDLLCRRLERKGYAATAAASGQEALELMQQQAFDLVLLDIMGVTGCPRRLHAANGSSPSSRVSIGSTNSRYGYKRWVSFSMRYRMKSSQSPLR